MWTIIYIYTDHTQIPNWEKIHAYERQKSVITNWQCWGYSPNKNYTVLLFSGETPTIKTFIGNEDQLIGVGTVSIELNGEKSVWIHHIEIFPEHVRKGYGKLLLSGLEEISKNDVLKSPKKNYYAEIVSDEIRFYLSMGYDEIFEDPDGDDNWDNRTRDNKRLYAKPSEELLDQEKLYFVPQDDARIFWNACEDGRKEAIQFLPFLDSFMEGSDEQEMYIIVRAFNLSFMDFELIYRHLMKIKYQTDLETMEELVSKDHLVKMSEICDFFDDTSTDYTKYMRTEMKDFLLRYKILDC